MITGKLDVFVHLFLKERIRLLISVSLHGKKKKDQTFLGPRYDNGSILVLGRPSASFSPISIKYLLK